MCDVNAAARPEENCLRKHSDPAFIVRYYKVPELLLYVWGNLA